MKMKQISTLIVIMLVTIFALSFQPVNAANSDPLTVSLHKVEEGYPDQDPDEKGVRIPPRPVSCIIQENGILASVDLNDIISYEIWDIDGSVCVASFTEELDFIRYLFSYSGEYQIRLRANDYYYIGYLSTL